MLVSQLPIHEMCCTMNLDLITSVTPSTVISLPVYKQTKGVTLLMCENLFLSIFMGSSYHVTSEIPKQPSHEHINSSPSQPIHYSIYICTFLFILFNTCHCTVQNLNLCFDISFSSTNTFSFTF